MEFNYLKVSGSVRKVLQTTFAVCTILLAGTAFSQNSNGKLDQKLQELVTKEALFQQDAEYVITSEHTSKISGTHHVYFT